MKKLLIALIFLAGGVTPLVSRERVSKELHIDELKTQLIETRRQLKQCSEELERYKEQEEKRIA